MRKGLRKSVYFLLGVGLIVGAVYGHNSVLAQTWQGSPSLGGGGGGVPSPLAADLYGGTTTRCFFTDATSTFAAATSEGICPNSSTGTTNLYAGGQGYLRGVNASNVVWKLDGSTGFTIGSAIQYRWSSTTDTEAAVDTGFRKLAAGVIAPSDGASGNGWLQVNAGRVMISTTDYTNATASFTNTPLSVSVTSGRKYTFRLTLMFSDSTAADGAQFDYNGGSATMTNFRYQCNPATNAAGAVLAQSASGGTALSTANSISLALTTQTGLECFGVIEPSSSSTFIVRAAQAAHSTGTLTVNRGSSLWVEDMP